MKLTTRSRYGTLIVLDVAQYGSDGPVRIQDIARRKNISLKYTEKITGELKRAGLLNSRRGPKGGHILTRAPADVTVGDVVRVLDWEEPAEGCPDGQGSCTRAEGCATRGLWRRAMSALMDHLDGVTIQDLLTDRARCSVETG